MPREDRFNRLAGTKGACSVCEAKICFDQVWLFAPREDVCGWISAGGDTYGPILGAKLSLNVCPELKMLSFLGEICPPPPPGPRG